MATAVAIPMPTSPRDDRHMPVLSTLDPSFSPSSLHLRPYTNPKRSPSMQPSPVMRASPTSSFSSTRSHDQDLSFSPSSPPRGAIGVPMGSRHERVPYDGPGMAVYVRQPTRAQLRENNGLFGSASRPYYYRDPEEKPFIDIDGKECGARWIYVDPKAQSEHGQPSRASKTACCIM
ncbi:hypothetical protein BMF94_4280 [Rhodotorula taiwanensis]|uniref:Uncharacterized protein n=1 Tax=Rhodotorula taiwanensis TaxID=741276 RepID=A0A2S5B6P2_9BASI|nr:hypothetical protein BMF94_4280 [Rhodotorula taiwanensis]